MLCLSSFRYMIEKYEQEKVFRLTLASKLCIDDTCDVVTMFDGLRVPVPHCNTDFTNLLLPGDGTIKGFVQELGGNIGSLAIDFVVQKLNLSVRLKSLNKHIPTFCSVFRFFFLMSLFFIFSDHTLLLIIHD